MKQNYTQPSRIEIDNAATFINWAKTVQSDLIRWTHPRCDYQDDYARTPHATIDAAFNEATPDERRLILCAVHNTMDYNEVERLLLVRAKAVRAHERTALYEEFDKVDNERRRELDTREQAISAREMAFKTAMKPYHKRLAEQRHESATLRGQLAASQERAAANRQECNAAKLDALEYEIKASRYDTIREILDIPTHVTT